MMRAFHLPPLPPACTLGINYSGMHDSAIAIVAPDGQPLFATSLERVSRVKQDGRPPHALLEAVPWDRIARVAVSTNAAFTWPAPQESRLLTTRLPQPRADGLRHPQAFHDFLARIPCEHEFVEHQEAHAASAFWGSGFEEALCLTYDGGMCNSPWFGGLYRSDRGTGLHALDRFSALHYAKVTSLYTFVTALLGFTPNKHEGKITGLAAYGRPTERCRALLAHWFEQDFLGIEAVMEWVFAYDEQQPPVLLTNEARIAPYRTQAAAFTREELAATVQALAEEHVVDLLARARDLGWTSSNLCLAGGLFANVKVNQRAVESGFERLFVAPPMTDDGTALGAAWHVQSRQPGFRPEATHSMFLGPAYARDEVLALLREEGVQHESVEAPERKLADLLAEGAVVAVFQGACEFGPRALGNRSILAQAIRPEINQQLNTRLNRTEFMPFAPMTRVQDMAACYVRPQRVAHAMEFMTVTVDCTEGMRRACPAVVHVDGTARPQIVTAEWHPLLHGVLTAYVERTGVPAIVNTSFNIHEEPIVCSPADALRGFFESGLDYLYLDGGVLVSFAQNHAVALRYLQERARQPAARGKGHALLAALQSHRVAQQQDELERKEAAIHEKEAAIHRLADELQVLTCSLLEKEELIGEQHQALGTQHRTMTALVESLQEKEKALQGKEAALQAITRSLHEKEDALHALDQAAGDKDQALHAKEDALQAITRSLHEKEGALHALVQAAGDKDQALQAKEDALQAITRSLHEKEDALQALAQAAREKDEALGAKEAALQELARTLQEKEDALQALARAASKQDSGRQEQELALQEKEEALQEKEKALQDVTRALRKKDKALAVLGEKLGQKEQALAAATAAAQEKEAQVQEKHRALTDLTHSLREKEAVIQALSAALEADRAGST